MKNKILLIFLLVILIIPLVSATLIFEKDTKADLIIPCIHNNTYCSSSATCETTIWYPNGTILIDNKSLTNLGAGQFNYSLNENETSVIGTYNGFVTCIDGSEKGYKTFSYKITANGKEDPSGVVIVFFSLGFLVVAVGLLWSLLKMSFKTISLSFNEWDLTFNVSTYIFLWGLYILGKEYMGSYFLNNFFVWLIGITAFTHMVLPIIVFVLCYSKARMEEIENER